MGIGDRPGRAMAGLLLFGMAAALALSAGAAGAEKAEPAPADLHGIEAAPWDASDLEPEERERIERLFSRIICACPRENWTKTLAGCPDGCSDRQKEMVRRGVKAGMTDEEILDEQVRTFGTEKVLAIPGSPLATWIPYLALLAFGAVVAILLTRSVGRDAKGSSGAPPDAGRPAGETAPEGASEEERRAGDAVERDLREMDA